MANSGFSTIVNFSLMQSWHFPVIGLKAGILFSKPASTSFQKCVDYSAKNIPLADKKTIMEMMIHAYEKFDRNISWRSWFKLNPVLKPELATLDLRHEIFSSCRHKDGKLLSNPP